MRRFKPHEVEFIQERACERISEVLDALGIEYSEKQDYLQFQCPIHMGESDRSAWWSFRNNFFRCETKHCERESITGRSNSVFGLIRGAMSSKDGKQWSFPKAVSFAASLLGISDIESGPKTEEDIEIDKLIKQAQKKKKKVEKSNDTLLSEVVKYLQPDNDYYPNRGISKNIISKYNISICNNRDKPFYKRVFFPILDAKGRFVLGWSARSIHGECSICRMHHNPKRMGCPESKDSGLFCKWKHSRGFKSETCLYGLNFSRPHISGSGVAVIVEGPGDLWALEQAGVKNGVALLGLNLSRHQRLLLQTAGALTLIFALDNDDAGRKAEERFRQDLDCYFRLFFIKPTEGKDIGGMSEEAILDLIEPVLNRASRAGVLLKGELDV